MHLQEIHKEPTPSRPLIDISRSLLIPLKTEAILQEAMIDRRREKLRAITDCLMVGDAYGAKLERIKAQGMKKTRLGIAARMWIFHSRRLFLVEELCHTPVTEIGSPSFNAYNVPSIRVFTGCYQGLLSWIRRLQLSA